MENKLNIENIPILIFERQFYMIDLRPFLIEKHQSPKTMVLEGILFTSKRYRSHTFPPK
jgi:hypothetical protein